MAMNIKNATNRKLEFQIAGHSSKTLWEGSVDPGTTVAKDLPESDAPFTPLGRWPADPPLSFNFIIRTSKVTNESTVTVDSVFPSFDSRLGS
jgi:hypothetical protein